VQLINSWADSMMGGRDHKFTGQFRHPSRKSQQFSQPKKFSTTRTNRTHSSYWIQKGEEEEEEEEETNRQPQIHS
jgi:hypothetical protein